MAKPNPNADSAAPAVKPCDCGSGLAYAACCGPLIAGREAAATAEALMRSRYTAYCEINNDYLLATWHRDTRPDEAPADADTLWLGLDILRCSGGAPGDNEGQVEFNARCQIDGRPGQLHEVSRFRFEQERWWYVDGRAPGPVRNYIKIGRNDPCSCGSGRKYKRCCGA